MNREIYKSSERWELSIERAKIKIKYQDGYVTMPGEETDGKKCKIELDPHELKSLIQWLSERVKK